MFALGTLAKYTTDGRAAVLEAGAIDAIAQGLTQVRGVTSGWCAHTVAVVGGMSSRTPRVTIGATHACTHDMVTMVTMVTIGATHACTYDMVHRLKKTHNNKHTESGART